MSAWPDYTTGESESGECWCKMRGETYVAPTIREALVLALQDWLHHPTAGDS